METVYLRGESGTVIPHDLPLPEGVVWRMSKGYITQVNADGSPLTDAPAVERPAATAAKPAWVAYAVSVDSNLSPDDADAMTKADLIEKYGK